MRGWPYVSFYSFCFMFSLMLAKRASDSISKRFVLITAKRKTRIHRNEPIVLSKTSEKVLKSIFALLSGNVFTLISFFPPRSAVTPSANYFNTRNRYKACVFYRYSALYLRFVIYIRKHLAFRNGLLFTRSSFPTIRSRTDRLKNWFSNW